MVRNRRAAGRTVAVLSIDPSSPFTHGALLGDRIRLTEHFLDPGVFIGCRHPAGPQDFAIRGRAAERMTQEVFAELDRMDCSTHSTRRAPAGVSEIGVGHVGGWWLVMASARPAAVRPHAPTASPGRSDDVRCSWCGGSHDRGRR